MIDCTDTGWKALYANTMNLLLSAVYNCDAGAEWGGRVV